jgi:adenosine deaminase
MSSSISTGIGCQSLLKPANLPDGPASPNLVNAKVLEQRSQNIPIKIRDAIKIANLGKCVSRSVSPTSTTNSYSSTSSASSTPSSSASITPGSSPPKSAGTTPPGYPSTKQPVLRLSGSSKDQFEAVSKVANKTVKPTSPNGSRGRVQFKSNPIRNSSAKPCLQTTEKNQKNTVKIPGSPELTIHVQLTSTVELQKLMMNIQGNAEDSWLTGQMMTKEIGEGHLSFEKLNFPKFGAKILSPISKIESIPNRNVRLTAELFERLKAMTGDHLLHDFLKTMCKVDLHCHLTGSIYSEDYLKIAIEKKLYFEPATCHFHSESQLTRIKAQELEENEKYKHYRDTYKKAMCMDGVVAAGPTDGHDHFFDKTWSIIESLTRYMTLSEKLRPVIRQDLLENVLYKELMIELLPSEPIPAGFKPLFAQGKLLEALDVLKNEKWLDSYVKTQIAKLNVSSAEMAKEFGLKVPSITDPNSPMVVGYMLEVMRDLPNDVFFAHIAAAMALISSHPDVVAVNIDGPEAGPLAIKNFDAQMKMLDFLWGQFGRPNISLHAGEVNLNLCAPTDISHHIRDSILIGKAKRIGHGASLKHENIFELLRLMKQRNVAVEICFSSNKQMLNIAPEAHPINLYLKYGIPVVICTDDEGILRSSLTDEYLMATKAYNLSYLDIKKICQNGVEYSFASSTGGNSKKDLLLKRFSASMLEFEASIAKRLGYKDL